VLRARAQHVSNSSRNIQEVMRSARTIDCHVCGQCTGSAAPAASYACRRSRPTRCFI